MFTIRSSHIDAFLPQGEAFIPWAMKHLREEHEEVTQELSDQVLEKRVITGVKRAQKYGLESPTARLAFIGLMFEVAPNFDEHPAIAEILNDTSLPEMTRIDDLTEKVSFVQWKEAEKNSNPNVWNA